MTETAIIVPCYNEERGLDSQGFLASGSQAIELLFVDDGLPDGTGAVLDSLSVKLAVHGVVAHTTVLETKEARVRPFGKACWARSGPRFCRGVYRR